MKKLFLLSFLITLSCSQNTPTAVENKPKEIALKLTEKEAYKISQLPITCITTEFPNKTSQSLRNAEDLGTPSELHPAFYGCFDWHSSVHGHWSIVSVLNNYPTIKNRDSLISILKNSITKEKITGEIEYFNRSNEYSFERTYGWAWLLKLSEALNEATIEELKELHTTLKPLTEIVVQRYLDYLPKLQYPTRVGTHTNTAFGLSLAYDYAIKENKQYLKILIEDTANRFYFEDENCPMGWEPGGSDFLSPCLEEADLMRKILGKEKFKTWFEKFLPEMKHQNYQLEVGIVSDRTDGHLVHLDGLNYSRAWCLYGLANDLGEDYQHLIGIANNHIKNAIENLNSDSYEGSHWLGTFTLYALLEGNKL